MTRRDKFIQKHSKTIQFYTDNPGWHTFTRGATAKIVNTLASYGILQVNSHGQARRVKEDGSPYHTESVTSDSAARRENAQQVWVTPNDIVLTPTEIAGLVADVRRHPSYISSENDLNTPRGVIDTVADVLHRIADERALKEGPIGMEDGVSVKDGTISQDVDVEDDAPSEEEEEALMEALEGTGGVDEGNVL